MKKILLLLALVFILALVTGGAGFQIRQAMRNQKQSDLEGAEYLAQGPIAGWRIVCDGRVAPVNGKIEITSENGGLIEDIPVQEGQTVSKGDVLVVMNTDRDAADVEIARAELALAEARLGRMRAGDGDEEVDSAWARVRSVEEDLTYSRSELNRLMRLNEEGIISADELEAKAQRVKSLEGSAESLRLDAAAKSRGGFREELAVAEAEVGVTRRRLERASLELEKALVRAPSDGVVLEIYRHAGDHIDTFVASTLTPIMSFADVSRLQIRAEIIGGDVYDIFPGLTGQFVIPGSQGVRGGKVVVNRLLPDFHDRKLMITDTRMPVDARTTTALCDIIDPGLPIYPGQRVTVSFIYTPREAEKLAEDPIDSGDTDDTDGAKGDASADRVDANSATTPLPLDGMASGWQDTEGEISESALESAY